MHCLVLNWTLITINLDGILSNWNLGIGQKPGRHNSVRLKIVPDFVLAVIAQSK